VISAPENREVIQATVPAAVFVSWDDEDAVDRALVSSRAITLGPGLGTDEGRRRLVSRCLEAARGTPCVVDADALNLRAGVPDGLRDLGASTVLTPHPGEMGRLLGRSVSEVTADPIEAATGLSRSTGATVLLKGAPTVVVSADGRVRVSSLISPAFAAGGMGDVLAGLIGAFLAGGLDGPDAGTAALMVSGIAVQSAEYPVGFSAEDLPDRLPGARAELDAAKLWRMAGLLAALPHATRSTE
jgi:NAD(P)H-hydrate epimerase